MESTPKWKGGVLTAAGTLSILTIGKEESKCVYRCRLDIRFGRGKRREFSSDCLYFLSELGMRRETLGDLRRARYEIVILESRQHIKEV